jgi:hypothetical protein
MCKLESNDWRHTLYCMVQVSAFQDGDDPAVIPVAACKGTNTRTPYPASSGIGLAIWVSD